MEKSAKRELTFKILYSGQINKEMNDEELQIFLGENNLKERDKEDIQKTINAINNNIEDITEKISKNLKDNWTIDRISKIDKASFINGVLANMVKELNIE